MQKAKNEKNYDYNIYKIHKDKVEDFKEHLKSRHFEEISLKQELIKNDGGFSFELMFCDKMNVSGMPWIDLLSHFTEKDLETNIRTFGAVIICEKIDDCYAVSYGNAHFYMNEFADASFGINVAERIIDLSSIKTQQNISQGSRKNKVLTDYYSGTQLSYKGGEIPTFVRGKSINEAIWGKNISCGISAQFKWKELPLEIGKKLDNLTNILKQNVENEIPKLIYLNSEQKIAELNNRLAKAIKEYDENKKINSFINIPYFYFVGTKIVQNESSIFKLSCKRKTMECSGDITIETIKEFLEEKEIDIEESILQIKIATETSEGRFSTYRPIIEFLEFITEDNFCLREGKWCTFNNSYLEQVRRDVRQIQIVNHNNDDAYKFDKDKLILYAKQKGIYPKNANKKRIPFETFYNNKLNETLKGKLIHPTTIPIEENADGRYKYEVCDILVGTDMYFVKIGKPHDFAYAVDQAMQTLEKIQNGYGKIRIPNGTEIEPKKFHLILIFDNRKTIVEKFEDVYSINFLVHLAELKQQTNYMGISLVVDFAYTF